MSSRNGNPISPNEATENKTVQDRILKYAVAIGWTLVSREEAEPRRGFEPRQALEEPDPGPFGGLGIASQAAAKPLKVYILAGQSNMQGHVNISTFDAMAAEPKTPPSAPP